MVGVAVSHTADDRGDGADKDASKQTCRRDLAAVGVVLFGGG